MLGMRRKKGIYTAILLVTCFVYVNWFVNISDWKSDKDNGLDLNEAKYLEESIAFEKQAKNKEIKFYEVKLSFDLVEAETSLPGKLFSLYTSGLNSAVEKVRHYEYSPNQILTKRELKDLLLLLADNRAVLLDLSILKNIIFKEKVTESSLFSDYNYNVENFEKIYNYFNSNE